MTEIEPKLKSKHFSASGMAWRNIQRTKRKSVLGYRGEQAQLFDEDFINELNSIEGIGTISLQREQTIIPEYPEDMFYSYILDKYQSQGMEAPGADYYGQYPNRFYTQLVSIDAD